MDLLSILTNIGVFSGITVFLFELFQNKVLKKYNIELNKTFTQILTWVFGFIVVYVTGLFDYGTFAGVTMVYTIFVGLLVGLTANGIWTIPPVNLLLNKVLGNK